MKNNKKKYNSNQNRMMKLIMTDGLNKYDAIEYEKLSNIGNFEEHQVFILKGPIEVRRGILLLKQSNLSYIGGPSISIP